MVGDDRIQNLAFDTSIDVTSTECRWVMPSSPYRTYSKPAPSASARDGAAGLEMKV